MDWISQHSVIPDYFRKQFYETGNLFPEFAMNLGGGQNIYNYSYYGLYSPLFLLSYALPFVKMSTYVINGVIMSDCIGAFIVSVAESKRIWQSCQLRCSCYFFADGTYDLPVLQPDYVR